MAELLTFLAAQLVDFPDEVNVDSEEQDDGLVLKLSVRPSDIGKVIGKQGRTARAIRNLMQAAAQLRDVRVHVHFVDA